MQFEGHLQKMKAELAQVVNYHSPLAEHTFALNPLIGQPMRLSFLGKIHCVACGKETKKSWQQGYCYPCTIKLAECDMCIVKPELCHYAQGTCRDPQWGENHCMKPHVVYLANSSGAKVGITRASQVPTRWIDQGAVSALPIFKVPSRLASGLVETQLAQHIPDKTHWQRMLKGQPEAIDLVALRAELLSRLGDSLLEQVEPLVAPVVTIQYPVEKYPEKVKSLGLDKVPVIEDTLVGIKGQYLMFASGVINLRNHAGYLVRWETL